MRSWSRMMMMMMIMLLIQASNILICVVSQPAVSRSKKVLTFDIRRNVTTSMVGLKTVAYAKISPKMVNPTAIAGYAEEEEEEDIRRKNYSHFFSYLQSL